MQCFSILKSKKLMLAVCVILLAVAMSAAAATKGDVNSDNVININDALLTARYSAGLSVSNFDATAADVNCDNVTNINDALMIARYSAGMLSGFPCQVTITPTVTATPTPTPTNTSVSKKFPYSPYTYPYGQSSVATDQNTENSYVQSEYASFKSKYLTSNGAGGYLRIQRPENSNDTVSEGIGYGMLLAVYFDEQSNFNGLWNYAKSHFDARGLMHWQINSSNTVIGSNAATDADEDMALALVFADKKWGGYQSDATAIINAIYTNEVEAGTYVLKPGDTWGGSTCTNISYYSPGAYKVFAEYTGNNNWNNVITKCYQVINAAKNASTGLVPDWCTASGGSTSEVTWDSNKDSYYYDAVRTPLRLSWHAIWYGDSSATTYLNLLTNFFASQGAGNIKGGYTLSGSVIGNYADGGFTGVAGAGAMGSTNRSFAQAIYPYMKSTKSNQYFQDCLRMLSLLVATGNFPNLSK